jgi:hypothetical protein
MREEIQVEWEGISYTVLIYTATCCTDWTAVACHDGRVVASAIGVSREQAVSNLEQCVRAGPAPVEKG